MKKITAIVRPEKLEPLKDALFEAKVSGMTISQVQGCGSQHGWKEYYLSLIHILFLCAARRPGQREHAVRRGAHL